VLSTSASLEIRLAAEAHLAVVNFLLEEPTFNMENPQKAHKDKLEE
jgi:hypothetical protein